MKKLFSLILVFTLTLALSQAACAAPVEPATAVTVSASESFTAAVRSDNPEVAAGFQALSTEAKSRVDKSEDMAELARFVLEYGDKKDASPQRVYKDTDGGLYLEAVKGNKLYKVDATSFYALVDNAGRDFYSFRPVPKATAGGKNLAITASSYAFLKLDGKLYRTQLITEAPATLKAEDGKLPAPAFGVTPKTVSVTVTPTATKEAVATWKGTLSEFSRYKPAVTGDYRAEFTAEYESDYYKGIVTYAYNFSHSAEIGFSVFGAGTNPGEVVLLKVQNVPEGAQVTASTDIQFAPKFYRLQNGDMAALLPVSYYTAPGDHYVEIKYGDVTKRFAISVGNKQFGIQHLTVPPATADETINSQKANNEYEKYIAPIRPVSDPAQYWSGRFIFPVKTERRITTEFGLIRYTNGSKTGSRHGALDIAAPAGTPVYASGAGRVLYSGFLQLTGNTVVIEHGLGLKTWHYHMNGLNVKTGDMVKQGQQIGIVGSTGFSTGAHLHFGMSVNNVFINPDTAIYTDLLAGF